MNVKKSMNLFARILAGLLAVVGTVVAAEPDTSAGPPAKASPAPPGWGFYPKRPAGWNQIFTGQFDRTRQGDVGVSGRIGSY